MMATNAIGSQGLYGLELILHESAHGMMAPIDSALAAASAGAKEQLAPWLSHLILFYTVGQLVHERVPDHVPYAEQFGIWRQSDAATKLATSCFVACCQLGTLLDPCGA